MYLGQATQDKFVLNILKEKKNGIFLEIGSNHPIHISNTYLLESKYDWKGIMVEFQPQFLPLYEEHRKNSFYVIDDATKLDYNFYFNQYNMPTSFDYLQIDLEVNNGSTIQTLEKLDNEVFDKYKFATVTFEHDIYNRHFDNVTFDNTRSKSRDIFKKRGYVCVFEDINHDNNPYEDWYVHPDLVDMNYVNNLIENNKKNYTYHSITEKTINCRSIEY